MHFLVAIAFVCCSDSDYWMFMPIVGPHLGAIIGSLFYDLCIGFHWPQHQMENQKNQEKIQVNIDMTKVN